ncbi:ATP-grasp domain-containing protein [Novosphingobium sp. Chol11]|uniref:ATP-grasp domain-containing protein n=1 Tax=Novosphingobium sp. Chol11 TaxID=1385763 RepID=UPI0025F7B765|nr:ATP-grasp domain-containing protein [Novosphingobium sp. Chol11]
MTTLWFNEGYSSIRDAVLMIREARGENLRVLASHRDALAPVLEAADASFVEPPIARTDASAITAYGDYCLNVCAERGVDLFIVQRGRAAMASRAAEFAAIGTRLATTGTAETLALISDKARFYEVALAAGIAMPWTREVTDAAGFDAACAEIEARGLKACVKPPHGVFGSGFWQLVDDLPLFETLMNADAHCIAPAVIREAIAAAPDPLRLLVLEHLPGTEWSFDCLCRDGRLVVGVARRKLGRAQRLETDGPLFAMARRAVSAFGLSGLINLQFKAAHLDHDNDIRLLEINPRMSGGCLYTRYSGVNLPWWQVALELGLADEADMPVPVGGALVAAVGEAQQLEGAAILPVHADA